MWLSALVERLVSVTALFPPLAERRGKMMEGWEVRSDWWGCSFQRRSCSGARLRLSFDIAELSQPRQREENHTEESSKRTPTGFYFLNLWVFSNYGDAWNKMSHFYYIYNPCTKGLAVRSQKLAVFWYDILYDMLVNKWSDKVSYEESQGELPESRAVALEVQKFPH